MPGTIFFLVGCLFLLGKLSVAGAVQRSPSPGLAALCPSCSLIPCRGCQSSIVLERLCFCQHSLLPWIALQRFFFYVTEQEITLNKAGWMLDSAVLSLLIFGDGTLKMLGV